MQLGLEEVEHPVDAFLLPMCGEGAVSLARDLHGDERFADLVA